MGRVVGWLLEPAERERLLAAFPPHYANVIAHHVTLWSDPARELALPRTSAGRIVGVADDDAGVQALVVEVGWTTERPDGSRYHVTWSLAEGRQAKESNDVIAQLGWQTLGEPHALTLIPARFSP